MVKREEANKPRYSYSDNTSPLEQHQNELLLEQLCRFGREVGVGAVKKEQLELQHKMEEWEATYYAMREVEGSLARAYRDLYRPERVYTRSSSKAPKRADSKPRD